MVILLEEGDGTKEEDELLDRITKIQPKNSKERWRVKYVGVTISRLIQESIEAGDVEEEIRLANKMLKLNPNSKRTKKTLERAKLEQKIQNASFNRQMSMKERGQEFRNGLNTGVSQVMPKTDDEQRVVLERQISE